MFEWLKRWGSKPLQPEASWHVTLSPDGIRGIDHTGAEMFVATDDLATVMIETNDSGPWGADVWWLMFKADGKLACAFPQGATGEKEALDFLMALPDFDEAEMIKAMGSTSNAVFEVWRKA